MFIIWKAKASPPAQKGRHKGRYSKAYAGKLLIAYATTAYKVCGKSKQNRSYLASIRENYVGRLPIAGVPYSENYSAEPDKEKFQRDRAARDNLFERKWFWEKAEVALANDEPTLREKLLADLAKKVAPIDDKEKVWLEQHAKDARAFLASLGMRA